MSRFRVLRLCLGSVSALIVCYLSTTSKNVLSKGGHSSVVFSKESLNTGIQDQDEPLTIIREKFNHRSLDRASVDIAATEESDTKLVFDDMSVRLGANLKFDADKCPPGSNVLHRKQDFNPEHQDCPTLFIVGARKGGTTSLIQYLSKHPDFKGINLDKGPKAGESFYFVTEYQKMTWEEYKSLFPPGVMSGESSVENLVYGAAPKRLYRACGKQAKVVMLLRDPIDRMMSAFLMRVKQETTKLNSTSPFRPLLMEHLTDFFKKVPKGSVNASSLPKTWRKFVNRFYPAYNMIYEGLYYVHLMNWLCNFPAENILIIRSENFFQHPSKILDTVVWFLGLKRLDLDMYDNITSVSYNSRQNDVPDYQKLENTDREVLLDVFKPFNQALFTLLEWNSSLWQQI